MEGHKGMKGRHGHGKAIKIIFYLSFSGPCLVSRGRVLSGPCVTS